MRGKWILKGVERKIKRGGHLQPAIPGDLRDEIRMRLRKKEKEGKSKIRLGKVKAGQVRSRGSKKSRV